MRSFVGVPPPKEEKRCLHKNVSRGKKKQQGVESEKERGNNVVREKGKTR
jgi:hypothetical protein